MRLDHLLSKELTAHAAPRGVLGVVATAHAVRVWGWLLMGGTLTKELESCRWCQYLRRPAPCVWVGVVEPHGGQGSGSSSTLLGPQVTGHGCGGAWYGSVRGSRTARSCFDGFPQGGLVGGWGWVGGSGCGSGSLVV